MSPVTPFLCGLLLWCTLTNAHANNVDDPLQSPSWQLMQKTFLNDHPVVFDNRIQVNAPDEAEDSLNVPVSVSVNGLEGVEQIIVFSDLNPIPLILKYYPEKTFPYFAFRFKVQQSTPVRAAALASDGKWHVNGRWISAMGGGCTVASVGRASGTWADYLGDTYGRLFDRSGEFNRLRFRVMHPMDTGLAEGIPAFYIKHARIKDDQGELLARFELFEPVSENPVLSMDVPNHVQAVHVNGADNNGNRFIGRAQ